MEFMEQPSLGNNKILQIWRRECHETGYNKVYKISWVYSENVDQSSWAWIPANRTKKIWDTDLPENAYRLFCFECLSQSSSGAHFVSYIFFLCTDSLIDLKESKDMLDDRIISNFEKLFRVTITNIITCNIKFAMSKVVLKIFKAALHIRCNSQSLHVMQVVIFKLFF